MLSNNFIHPALQKRYSVQHDTHVWRLRQQCIDRHWAVLGTFPSERLGCTRSIGKFWIRSLKRRLISWARDLSYTILSEHLRLVWGPKSCSGISTLTALESDDIGIPAVISLRRKVFVAGKRTVRSFLFYHPKSTEFVLGRNFSRLPVRESMNRTCFSGSFMNTSRAIAFHLRARDLSL